jgi:excisionase family DNA binding protein
MVTPKVAYSPQEVAAATSLSLRRVIRAIAAGELKSTKLGRRRIICADDLQQYVRGATVVTARKSDCMIPAEHNTRLPLRFETHDLAFAAYVRCREYSLLDVGIDHRAAPRTIRRVSDLCNRPIRLPRRVRQRVVSDSRRPRQKRRPPVICPRTIVELIPPAAVMWIAFGAGVVMSLVRHVTGPCPRPTRRRSCS